MTDPVWVSSEEIVVVSSSPSSDSDTLHRMEEGLDNLMVEIALDLEEGIPVMDVESHVSSCNPLLPRKKRKLSWRDLERRMIHFGNPLARV